jgi:hypothetical protein
MIWFSAQPQRESIERACARLTGRALAVLPVAERAHVLLGPVTIDLDAKDIEVFSTRKEQVIRSYKGEIAGGCTPRTEPRPRWRWSRTCSTAALMGAPSPGPDRPDRGRGPRRRSHRTDPVPGRQRLAAKRKAIAKMREIAQRYPRMFAHWRHTTAAVSI